MRQRILLGIGRLFLEMFLEIFKSNKNYKKTERRKINTDDRNKKKEKKGNKRSKKERDNKREKKDKGILCKFQ